MINFDIITIFPEMFDAIFKQGIVARALQNKLFQAQTHQLRDFSDRPHKNIDDSSYGGEGQVMMLEPLEKALRHCSANSANVSNHHIQQQPFIINSHVQQKPFVIYMSPQGRAINQELVSELSLQSNIVLVCGRYEGLDQRFIDQHVDLEVSVGDFVVSGGEIPAMLLIDAIVRQKDGVIKKNSVTQDSFMNGLLDFPHYTKPSSYQGKSIPAVLLSGDHEKIRKWRLYESLLQTYKKRPDLLRAKTNFSKEELKIMLEIINP